MSIGTPATRAAIITTLIKRDYIARSGKSIIPTEKGMYIYEAVKDMRVADVELTGSWEKTLAQVERHTLDTETFMQSILDYTRRATEEILRLDFPAMQERAFTCPKCKTGKIILRSKVARCDHDGCGLLVFRRILNKELTDTHMEQLFSSGTTRLIKGFKGKKGVPFDAAVTFDAEYNTVFSFPKTGNGKKKTPSFQFAGKGSAPPFPLQGQALRVSGKIILAPLRYFPPKTLPVEAVRIPALEMEKTVSPVNTGMS